jgi:fucose 4-O-acetylase-like acetyltransferase
MKPKTSTHRLEYLDWVRGIGALIMLQGHVFHSFLRNDLRDGGPYILSQFVGGMPPAIFLFLTGVTLSFMMDSAERKGMKPLQRLTTAFRRSGYLFFLAFAFRLQLWVFGQPAPWTDLFRVDILNCMGFAIALCSVLAAFRTVDRARAGVFAGLAIACASPLVTQMDTSWMPSLVRAYIVPDYNTFSFFPWGAYLAFGVGAGSVIRAVPRESIERAMPWIALTGGGAILGSMYFAAMPYSLYPKSEYWLNSPAQILTKQGIVLLMLAFGFVWTRYAVPGRWSWVRQLGTTSLLVYWVHIEMVYGRWLWFWKTNLSVPQVVTAAIVLILLMVGLSTLKTYRHRVAAALAEMGWWLGPKPDRVPGD